MQAGAGRQVASAAFGASRDWHWRCDTPHTRITGATEVLIGDWRAREPGQHFTQLGITPVLRLHPYDWDGGWFLESGIGANAATPHCENRGENFVHLRYLRRF